jgi:hypothetical protein
MEDNAHKSHRIAQIRLFFGENLKWDKNVTKSGKVSPGGFASHLDN